MNASSTLAEKAAEIVRLADIAARPNVIKKPESEEYELTCRVLGEERAGLFAWHDCWYLEAAARVSRISVTFDSPKDAERFLGATELGCAVLAIRTQEVGERALRQTLAEIETRKESA